jgi:hypothetical protein
MSENEVPLFFAENKKVSNGRGWVISTCPSVFEVGTDSWVGTLNVAGRNRRFSLWAPNPSMPGVPMQVMGLAFYDVEDKKLKCRSFRLCVPLDGAYNPITEDRDLGRLAASGIADPAHFKIYSSKLPERTPDGKLILRFGDVFVMSSIKNFIVEDEQGNCLYMIYRSSSGTCSLKVKPPFTPLLSFAIGLAVITSDR